MVSSRGLFAGRVALSAVFMAGLLASAPVSAQLAADRDAGTLKSDPVVEAAAPAQTALTEAEAKRLDCRTGPIIKKLGETWWYVFSCSDDKSMIFVTDKRNPAYPFIFFALAQEDRYDLRGEGNGDEDKAAPAFTDLEGMTAQQLFAWVEETQSVPKAQ